MPSKSVTGVNPQILRWARTTVNMTLSQVATTLKRKSEEIEAWENGTSAPTYSQLEKLAYEVYKRPLATFFLPVVPEEKLPKSEFRTLPLADMETLEKDTCLKIRKAHAYQLSLFDIFSGKNPANQKIWKEVLLSFSDHVATQAQLVREKLGITLQKQIDWKSDEQALKAWRQAIEECGIFVFKDTFKQKDISGFCLIDENFPIILINNSTTKTRQIFSLMHELAHLLLDMNGISKFDSSYINQLSSIHQKIEQFCNAIAAEILIPEQDFREQVKRLPSNVEQATEEQFATLAKRYGVSREAVLRRLLDKGYVSRSFYNEKSRIWTAQLKKTGSGGDWYRSQKTYISERFAGEVIGRHYRQQISLEQAAELLGLKPKNYAKFEETFLQGASV
ncbi:MAG: XRE family transcriptional regulator [Neisseriaceae bacterium]|nr:XRE family transcriptional regulator [Neisseriaceae bacterium]